MLPHKQVHILPRLAPGRQDVVTNFLPVCFPSLILKFHSLLPYSPQSTSHPPHHLNSHTYTPVAIDMENLPREVLLAILRKLDYIDLKNCFRVCSIFKQLLESRTFDARLFRSSVVERLQESDMAFLELHPAFDYFKFECAADVRQVHYYSISETRYDLESSTVAGELASSPGVPVMRLQVHRFPVFFARNKQGVTVLDVYQAMCDFFSTSPKGDIDAVSHSGKSPDWDADWDPADTAAIYFDFLFDHCVFVGWTEKLLDAQGRLVLRAYLFDS